MILHNRQSPLKISSEDSENSDCIESGIETGCFLCFVSFFFPEGCPDAPTAGGGVGEQFAIIVEAGIFPFV